MTAVRVDVVSDSHLAARCPEAEANWAAVVAFLEDDGANLVIHTGDISADGEHRQDDLVRARELLDPLEHRLLVLPGNHDIGDVASATSSGEPTIDDDRLETFRSVMGTDRWCVAVGRWHLVGINSQLLGSGLDAEHEQWDWLTRAIGSMPVGAPAALFLHKPIHAHGRPDDDLARPGRYVPVESRARLADVLGRRAFRAVVSGHVHQWGVREDPELTTVWAPSTWVVFPEDVQATIETKRAGLVSLTLHDDGTVDAALVEPPGLRQLEYGRDVVLSG